MVFVLPYVEQPGLYNAWNAMGDNRTRTGLGTITYSSPFNITVTSTRLNTFSCPTDTPNAPISTTVNGVTYAVTSHNYVVNFGNLFFNQDQNSYLGIPFLGAPFGDIGSPLVSYADLNRPTPVNGYIAVKLSAITDGLTNTMMASEAIIGQGTGGTYNAPYDLRGFAWWYGGATYETWLGPNSPIPDQMESASYCVYPGFNNPPCVPAPDVPFKTNAARSRHPGGVNAGMCDGSVRFVKNSISLNVWRALSTIQGNEVLSSDSY
jgi:prepilin-type processing-associated H-X9-DG protein